MGAAPWVADPPPAFAQAPPTHIYWTNFTSGTIGRANLDGTSVAQDFMTVPLVVEGAVYASPAGQPLAAGRATPALALPE